MAGKRKWVEILVKVRMSVEDRLSEPIPAMAREGLAVHLQTTFNMDGTPAEVRKGWRITHIGTGLGLGPEYRKQADAKAFANEVIDRFPGLWLRGLDIYLDDRIYRAGHIVRREMEGAYTQENPSIFGYMT